MKIRRLLHFALPLLVAVLTLARSPGATAQSGMTDGRGAADFASPLVREAPVVVSITTTRRTAQGELGFTPDSFAAPAQRPAASRDPWPRTRRAEQERGVASGIVISNDGEILTNAHAVADVDRAVDRPVALLVLRAGTLAYLAVEPNHRHSGTQP